VHYYWAGLDYVKWALLVAGAAFFFYMQREESGEKRGWLKLAACITLALGIFSGAVAGVLFNKRAAHLTAEGFLAQVVVNGGRGASTQFQLVQPTGTSTTLKVDSALRWIHDGDPVHVVYQDGSYAVLSLTEISGANAGVRVDGNDGGFGSWVALTAAVILAGYGIADWFNDGNAVPSEPADREMPDGDVDSKSMLNLSRPD
jgi:hypothetical protein